MPLFSPGHYLACDLSAKAVNEPYLVSGERHASGYIENRVTDKVKIYYLTSFSHSHNHYTKPEAFVINEAPEDYEVKAFTVKVSGSNYLKAPSLWENLDPKKVFHKKFHEAFEAVPQKSYTLISSYPKGVGYIEISALLFDKKTDQLLDSFSLYQSYPEKGKHNEKDLHTAHLFGHHTRLD